MRKSSSSLMFMGVMFFIMGMILVVFSLMFYMITGSGSIFLFVGISSIFLISGILSFIKGIKSKRIIKRVLAMNFIIQAQIVDFRRGYLSGRISTYILKASAISPYDGKRYITLDNISNVNIGDGIEVWNGNNTSPSTIISEIDGNKIKIRAREELAIAFQHEIDHLNGILFIDHIDKKNPYKDQDKYRPI